MSIIYAITKIEVVTKKSELVGNDGRIWVETYYNPQEQIALCDSLETAHTLLSKHGYTKEKDEDGIPYVDRFVKGFPNSKNEDEKFQAFIPSVDEHFIYGKPGYIDNGGREGWIGDIVRIKEICVISIGDVEFASLG